jgi:hypothetical protein
MPVRPKDLVETQREQTLHCGHCLLDYPAIAECYSWMFDGDLIVCEGCGEELVVMEKVMVES